MNYKVAIKIAKEPKGELRDRILKHVASCPTCRELVKKRDEHH